MTPELKPENLALINTMRLAFRDDTVVLGFSKPELDALLDAAREEGRKAAYLEGWNDRENDLIAGVARITGEKLTAERPTPSMPEDLAGLVRELERARSSANPRNSWRKISDGALLRAITALIHSQAGWRPLHDLSFDGSKITALHRDGTEYTLWANREWEPEAKRHYTHWKPFLAAPRPPQEGEG